MSVRYSERLADNDIVALLGHKTLAMTMVYARIADKPVAQEYLAVTEKVEALYGQAGQLDSSAEGQEMRKLRVEMHRRMLGNGYCARPVEMDCQFESTCEYCTFFVTTVEFRPTLQRQRDDAARKGARSAASASSRACWAAYQARPEAELMFLLDRITHISTTPRGCTVRSRTTTPTPPQQSSRLSTTVR